MSALQHDHCNNVIKITGEQQVVSDVKSFRNLFFPFFPQCDDQRITQLLVATG